MSQDLTGTEFSTSLASEMGGRKPIPLGLNEDDRVEIVTEKSEGKATIHYVKCKSLRNLANEHPSIWTVLLTRYKDYEDSFPLQKNNDDQDDSSDEDDYSSEDEDVDISAEYRGYESATKKYDREYKWAVANQIPRDDPSHPVTRVVNEIKLSGVQLNRGDIIKLSGKNERLDQHTLIYDGTNWECLAENGNDYEWIPSGYTVPNQFPAGYWYWEYDYTRPDDRHEICPIDNCADPIDPNLVAFLKDVAPSRQYPSRTPTNLNLHWIYLRNDDRFYRFWSVYVSRNNEVVSYSLECPYNHDNTCQCEMFHICVSKDNDDFDAECHELLNRGRFITCNEVVAESWEGNPDLGINPGSLNHIYDEW